MSPARDIAYVAVFALALVAPVVAAPLIRTVGAPQVVGDVVDVLKTPANRVVPLLLAPALDPSKLVRFRDRDYLVGHNDSVSMTPLGTMTVRKIAGGQVSEVVVVRTETGTYSNEATISPHFRYPGITVVPLPQLPPGYSYSYPEVEDEAEAVEPARAMQGPAPTMQSRGSFIVLPPLLRCPSSSDEIVCV